MTRKRCKRKVYALIDPIATAINGARITSEARLDERRVFELSQIDSMDRGAGTLEDLRNIADMVNVSATMASIGIGPEAKDPCQIAEDAIISIMRRFERWSKMEATPTEMASIKEVFGWYDAQRSAISNSEYQRAIRLTVNRIRGAHPSVKNLL